MHNTISYMHLFDNYYMAMLHMTIIDMTINYTYVMYIYSNHTNEDLPDIIWCREPFMKVLNDNKDIN